LFFWVAKGARRRISALELSTVGERLRAVLARFAWSLGQLAAFTLGSVGAFLAFDWPPLLREIVLSYILAFLALRSALVIGQFFLAPVGGDPEDVARFRITPMGTSAARYWYRRIAWLVSWFAFGYVTIGLLNTLGFQPDARRLVAYVLGLGLLAIGLEIAWRQPCLATGDVYGAASRRRWNTSPWLVSGYFIALWLLWVVGGLPAFLLAVVAGGLPVVFGVMQRSITHVLRPPGALDAGGPPGVLTVCLERGARALLIIGAAFLLAWAWRIDLVRLASQDSVATRLLRDALNVVVIALIADFVWHVLKALIDRRLVEARDPRQPDTDEGRRRARLRTLLPMLANLVFIVLMVAAVLMALSSMGFEIGPLIAGAGVVGVAVGFGAQTVVK